MTGLGTLLLFVYVAALVCEPARRVARMGADNVIELSLYPLGGTGLVAMAGESP